MNITEMLGTPVNDPPEFDSPAGPACVTTTPPQPAAPRQPPRIRLVWVALVAAALLVGTASGWYLATATAESAPAEIAQPADVASAHVGDFAEMFTALHLSGRSPTEEPDVMYSRTSPSATGTWINQSAAVLVEPLTLGFWNVVVAVDVLELVDDAYESAGIQYFGLTVDASGLYPVAVSAPARLPAPISAATPGLTLFTDTVPTDQADTVTHFLSGYLTAQEETARYVTPTARIRPFPAPPYESISIASIGSDSQGRVSVSVAATTPTGAVHMLQYTAEMSFEAGVWEVSALTSVASPE